MLFGNVLYDLLLECGDFVVPVGSAVAQGREGGDVDAQRLGVSDKVLLLQVRVELDLQSRWFNPASRERKQQQKMNQNYRVRI